MAKRKPPEEEKPPQPTAALSEISEILQLLVEERFGRIGVTLVYGIHVHDPFEQKDLYCARGAGSNLTQLGLADLLRDSIKSTLAEEAEYVPLNGVDDDDDDDDGGSEVGTETERVR